MHKRYEDYRFQVMYQHPKLSEDPDKFECYYETNFIDHAKYYAITLLGKGATVYVFDKELNQRVRDLSTLRTRCPSRKTNKADRASERTA